MKRVFFFAVLVFFFALEAQADKPKSLFYLTGDSTSIHSFLAHADKVDLLVPAWYNANAEGLVSGGPNPLVMEAAKQHHVPVMPLLVNAGFVQTEFHKFLGDAAAQTRMLDALIRVCKENGYIGIQFDFENVRWTDSDALSALVRDGAAALHREGLQISIATVPNAPGGPASETAFSAWLYENWRGSYDLKAIGEAVDLVCLMTYDENTQWTVPGPVAGRNWTIANIDYALKVVPPGKLSLGIPLYGYHWFAGMPVNDTSELG
jgi:spore germination protein YaaH